MFKVQSLLQVWDFSITFLSISQTLQKKKKTSRGDEYPSDLWYDNYNTDNTPVYVEVISVVS